MHSSRPWRDARDVKTVNELVEKLTKFLFRHVSTTNDQRSVAVISLARLALHLSLLPTSLLKGV